jgi:hypothetical protein
VIDPRVAMPPAPRRAEIAGRLMSTKRVRAIGSRGRSPGATSSRRGAVAARRETSGHVLKRSGAISHASRQRSSKNV